MGITQTIAQQLPAIDSYSKTEEIWWFTLKQKCQNSVTNLQF
jgi:hypothetical protein